MSESELPEEKIEQEKVQDSQMSQETGEVKQTEEAVNTESDSDDIFTGEKVKSSEEILFFSFIINLFF